MTTNVERPASAPQPGQPFWRPILAWPSTRLGWWSVGLTAAFAIMMLFNGAGFMQLPEEVAWRQPVLPFYGIAMMGCGLASGITALVALLRRHERSGLVWLPVLAGLFVIVFLLGEFLVPH